MQNDFTDITVVVDRSGSMSSIKADAEGGINTFITEQQALPGLATLTLVQFDTEYEFIHKGKPISEVGPYRLVPRGGTALLDAVGRAIAETGERLSKLAEADRPALVVFVIVTDGEENSSKEFTLTKVKEAITHQQEKYQWQFTFLAANQDAFSTADRMGISRGGVANFAPANAGKAYAAISSKVGMMRGRSASGQSVSNAWTEEEREELALVAN